MCTLCCVRRAGGRLGDRGRCLQLRASTNRRRVPCRQRRRTARLRMRSALRWRHRIDVADWSRQRLPRLRLGASLTSSSSKHLSLSIKFSTVIKPSRRPFNRQCQSGRQDEIMRGSSRPIATDSLRSKREAVTSQKGTKRNSGIWRREWENCCVLFGTLYCSYNHNENKDGVLYCALYNDLICVLFRSWEIGCCVNNGILSIPKDEAQLDCGAVLDRRQIVEILRRLLKCTAIVQIVW